MNEAGYKGNGTGFFAVISFLIFILSVFLWGGVYMYGKFTENRIENNKESLRKDKESYESSLISEITGLSEKIKAAEVLIGKHAAFSGVLDFLQANTLKSVTFKNLLYNVSESGKPNISMNGTAKDYTELAVQANIFERSGGAEEVLFSGLKLNDAGQVNFDVKITLNPSVVSYGFVSPENDILSNDEFSDFEDDFDDSDFEDEEEF